MRRDIRALVLWMWVSKSCMESSGKMDAYLGQSSYIGGVD